MSSGPLVSVVVIVHNDQRRLGRAVRSVLTQSLRQVEIVIVDDGSTDASPQVAADLAARHPERVRVLRHTRNSGGCGRPRNTGIRHARGEYVMFLDSDDTLDRHACRTMYGMAEETGADIVSGRCVRVVFDAEKVQEETWYPGLYRSRAVHYSLAENPSLLYDSLATNKCYRRSLLVRHGIHFNERHHYEDLLFSVQALLAAESVAIIPHRVYNWHVGEGGASGTRPSISNRRDEIRNLVDRLEIHRLIDEALLDHDEPDLKLRKDVKFLRHDLTLYVREYPLRDPEYQAEFRTRAGEYVRTLDPRALEQCGKIRAIAAFLVARGDHQGIAAVGDYLRDGRPPAGLAEREQRIYWSDRHLEPAGERRAREAAEGRRVLDVTGLGFHCRPLARLRLVSLVTGMRVRGGRVELTGKLTDPLGRLGRETDLSAVLELRSRRRTGPRFRIPVTSLRCHDGFVHWEASSGMGGRCVPALPRDRQWTAELVLFSAEGAVKCRLALPDSNRWTGRLPIRPLSALFMSTALVPYMPCDRLTFRLEADTWHARLGAHAAQALIRVYHWCGLGPLMRSARRLRAWAATSPRLRQTLYEHVFTRLPIRRGSAVFESHLGLRYSDSPKYIYEYLRETAAPMRPIWSYQQDPSGFPAEARLVKRGSLAYYRALARAEFWIDNQGFPAGIRKRPGTTYLQTWHGSAFKTMGVDEPRLKLAPESATRRLREMTGRFDYFVVRSEHDVRTLVPGLGVTGELLRTGYPRNDALVSGLTGGEAAELDRLRDMLGLPDGRKVVLYAPTFRGHPRRISQKPLLPFDDGRFVAEFGGELVLLVRAHYLRTGEAHRLPLTPCGSIWDVSHVPDVTALLLLADALVTDYSSLMFDYALLRRPMIFYAPDLEEYVTEARGAYFDLAEQAPGPVVSDEEGLFAALRELDELRVTYAPALREFAERYGEYDDGAATRRIAERVFPDSWARHG